MDAASQYFVLSTVPSSLLSWLNAHGELPIGLRVWVVVPATIMFVAVGGLGFTLPPGPLCDEGMVLFMEGGCDWGRSNEFFFSKLGLLVAMNIVFAAAWLYRVRKWQSFLPHFIILALLTVANHSDEYCRHYYSHPNGSIGQMTAEAISFGVLGIALLFRIPIRNFFELIGVIAGWNALHVAVFYLALLVADHWTWLHSILVIGTLAGVAAAATRR